MWVLQLEVAVVNGTQFLILLQMLLVILSHQCILSLENVNGKNYDGQQYTGARHWHCYVERVDGFSAGLLPGFVDVRFFGAGLVAEWSVLGVERIGVALSSLVILPRVRKATVQW